jgi:transcription-repair coupling factor (superfamily II helicase)
VSLRGIVDALENHEGFSSLVSGLRRGYDRQVVTGASSSAKSLLASLVREATGRSVLVVTSNVVEAEKIVEECETWLGRGAARLFPPLEVLPYEVVARSDELEAGRIAVLEHLAAGGGLLLVAPVGSLLRRVVPPSVMAGSCVNLEVGQQIPPAELAEVLVANGYERFELAEARGQCAARGGIVDVYPRSRETPVRIEFWGDEIQSIREYDPASQRSFTPLRSAFVGPAREFLVRGRVVEEGLERIRKELEATASSLEAGGHRAAANRLRTRVRHHIESMEAGRLFEGLEHYLPYFYREHTSPLDYLQPDSIVIVDDIARVAEAASEVEGDAREVYASGLGRGALLPGQASMYVTFEELRNRLDSFQCVYSSLLPRNVPGRPPANHVHLDGRPAQSFHGQWKMMLEEFDRARAQGATVVCAVGTRDRARSFSDGMRQYGLETVLRESLEEPPRRGTVTVSVGALEEGLEIPSLKLVVLSDGEIFGRVKRRRTTVQPRERPGAALEDLKIGDYVVHANHGIGKYLGVRTLEIEGVLRDYLFIKYAGADALYVPTDQSHLVHKYVGGEGREPRLNKLGGTEWSRTKSRAEESVKELAGDLLRLYAMRQAAKGYAFSPDTPWQREFEDAFRYEETPDQRQATEEIKRDMEQPRPMDRLLCGDVGYGKTEVAMRASFKSVNDGKQVAILVPTTILAQQHYATFRERFSGYPVRIEVLSRFKTAREQERLIEGLRNGSVDVVIGTHRLLQDDVVFHDLGLLVIDEEHRFGVVHKEKIKKLKQTVDVLTMSATPIPRTLKMALSGFRDMSVIETPPEDRFPVQTFVVEQSDDLIRAAIARELNRNGQVYYVHNRVQTIERVAARLKMLVPFASIAMVHGQMREDKLERTMLEFLEGEYDVLLCTTIIESGLDIGNVNTLIVEDADQLGLAQLYQLRGRVGRSNRLAYAYFLYRPDRTLHETAEKRLEAIREFTELGSGFKIAMRDLEIRGAGNILGAEQHGFIASVGYDLYLRMLEEAVEELKGRKYEEPPAVSIEVSADAYLPDSYVPDSRQKMDMYRKMAAIREQRDAEAVAEELLDRFGPMPVPVANLLAVARIRLLASRVGIASISQTRDRIQFRIGDPSAFPVGKAQALARQYRGRVTMPGRGVVCLRLERSVGRTPPPLAAVESFLDTLASPGTGT